MTFHTGNFIPDLSENDGRDITARPQRTAFHPEMAIIAVIVVGSFVNALWLLLR